MAKAMDNPHMERFLKNQRANSENTYKTRKTDLNHFHGWLQENGYELEDAETWMLHDYFRHLQSEGYAPATIGGRWDSIFQLFKDLSRRGIIEDHPMGEDDMKRGDYTSPKNRAETEAEDISYVTKGELENLVAHVPDPKLRNRLLLRLMFQTGLRANEVTRVRLSDLSDWDEEEQEFEPDERSIEIYAKKTHDRRTVYYQESLDFLLKEWLEGGYRAAYPTAGESEYLFVTRQREKIYDSHINRIVKDAAENAGIQEELYTDMNGHSRYLITAHTLRHGHAVYSLKCGIDIRTISKHMGHEHLEMTKRYLDLIDEDVRDAYRDNWGRA